MATFLDSLMGGMKLGQQVRGLQDQGNINRLAGQAANSSGQERTSALNQMWGVNPEMAAKQETALGTSEDRRNKGMVNAARLITNAPESMRPALYQQMKPTLAQYGLQLPEQYDQTVSEAASALVKAYGGASDSIPTGLRQFQGIAEAAGLKSGTTEYQRAARVNLGLDPRAVTAAVRFDTFTDANGNPRPQRNNPTTGQVEIFIDESNQWQPLGGGISVQQPPHTGANTIFTTSDGAQIDVSTVEDPYVRQQILANPAAFGMVPGMGAVQLPDRDTSRVNLQAPRGIGVGQSKAAEAAAVEQAKTNVQLGALPAELGMRSQAAINQAVGIEQGKSAAERQSNARAKAPQLLNVERGLTRINAALNGLDGMLVDTGPVDGMAMRFTEAGQELEAAVGAIQNDMLALTRVPGIGSQSDLEARIANLKYPSIYNHPSVNKRNTEQLIAFLSDLEKSLNASGQPANSGATQAQQQVQRARNPQTGEVVEYRNGQWVKVQ